MKKAIIIGAGPAGLTAAYELLTKTDIKPIIFEAEDCVGGICKTINVNGNRMDLGGHRFFSKSDSVMSWWVKFLQIEKGVDNPDGPNPKKMDDVFLIKNRLSRIYFLKKFFDYPISLSYDTVSKLGIKKMRRIILYYIQARIFKIKDEKSLEDFFINRFGQELYRTFFKDYTEKLWGVLCKDIKPDWGAQRIKGVSLSKAVAEAIKKRFIKKQHSISQKDLETSLIEKFLYPKYGPGQLWEKVAREVKKMGGEIHLKNTLVGLKSSNEEIISVTIVDSSGRKKLCKAEYFISSMPIRDLIKSFDNKPAKVKSVAEGLVYRDFMTVGLLAKKIVLKDRNKQQKMIRDNWLYIQEPDVKIGRIQIFNNWSQYLVKEKKNVWLGLEYFCNEGDEFWTMRDKQFSAFAISELEKINVLRNEDVLKTKVVRVKKAYPAYFGTYGQIEAIKIFTSKFKNLYLVGRNGMHRYNNIDHSMLTAMAAVENIIKKRKDNENIWQVNAEQEYHEKKSKT